MSYFKRVWRTKALGKSEPTVFEKVWQNPDSNFLYRNDQSQVGVVADEFPKFPDQVVLFPAQGFPECDHAIFSDLPFSTQLALSALMASLGQKMRGFSGVPSVMPITRIDGFAVPNHPHIVMFPALRGESSAYTEPSRFQDSTTRRVLVERTMRNLSLTKREIADLDEKLKLIRRISS